MRWVNDTLPPRPRRRWLLMTIRLSISSLAGTSRTLVAVGTPRLAVMLMTVRAAAPRSLLTSVPSGSGGVVAAGTAGAEAAGAAGGGAAGAGGACGAGAAWSAGAAGAAAGEEDGAAGAATGAEEAGAGAGRRTGCGPVPFGREGW